MKRHFKCQHGLDIIRVEVMDQDYYTGDGPIHREAAIIALDKTKRVVDYGVMERIDWTVSEVFLKEGEIHYGQPKIIDLYIPQKPLGEERLAELQDEYLIDVKGLPPKVVAWIKGYAWEQGHSSGCDEVWSITQDIADGLGEALK